MSDDPLDLDTGLPARIAADAAALAPFTLSVARRLPASADTDGVMRPDFAKLARELGVDVAAIKDALDQLRRRGHLIVETQAQEYCHRAWRRGSARSFRECRSGYAFT
jgi:hypothetical protein